MIYDTFLFFNELELLELRLHELTGVVDRFVVVEATRTFTGKPKPLHFQENAQLFRTFNDQIIHVVVDDLPASTNPWDLEDFQRDCLARGLRGCQPDDLVLVSDADEIPRAAALRSAASVCRFRPGAVTGLWHRLFKQRPVVRLLRNLFKKWHPWVMTFEQGYHAYFLNCVRQGPPWLGTRMTHYRDLSTPNDLRRWKGRLVADGGWHFTYMGGLERIQAKLDSFSHQEFNRPEYTDAARLSEALRLGRNILDPNMKLRFEAIDAAYPDYLRKHPERFAKWIREVPGAHST